MPGTEKLTLKIEGMHCAGCVHSIEQGMKTLDGVEESRVNLATRSAVVIFKKGRVDPNGIINKISGLGYRAYIGTPDILTVNDSEVTASRQNFFTSLILTMPLMAVAMWPMFTGDLIFSFRVDGIIQAVLAGIVLLVAGREILTDAFRQTIHGRANMNSLIALGTVTAFGWSLYLLVAVSPGNVEPLYFDSAGMIVTLILLGRFFESRARGKAGLAIQALLNLRPSHTVALINDIETEIEAALVRPGMLLLIKPGQRVAADGEIVEGRPVIDESMLTGESVPVDKKVGDRVIGGSLNANVPFKMKVTAAGEESYLARIIRLVTEAQEKKAPVQKLADRVASVFVPIVIALAGITFIAWYLLDPNSPMLIKSVISVLIIACPCALGLATPTAILAGTGRAAREGIIIRGGDILENLSRIDTVVFDKTGTLTFGELEVTEVVTFGQLTEKELLRLAAEVESRSEHPLARAITRSIAAAPVKRIRVDEVQARPGFGMTAICDGRKVTIGNKALMEAEEIIIGQALTEAEKEMEQGRTVIFVAVDGRVVGIIALADRLRGDARDIIDRLHRNNQQVTMLTGDNRKTAEGVAQSLGLDNFEAEIKPDQKKVIVESFRKAGYNVAMVGDGINDAPALAMANVGVAIGNGTDVAIEAADVILVSSDLMDIQKMFNIALHSMKIIKQNLFWAFIYNIIAIPVAAGLFYPLFRLTLTPMLAAFAMSFSSVFVVSNSLRLNRLDFN
ncbi:MAG: copper-translocating P-type ATPase [candidate division Zixibacteria bacterium]|nr:copper-translocating P-type ATPase [candidate division Zixibacteria bacterium]